MRDDFLGSKMGLEGCARMYESLANSNRRSRCHCWLRLVVRYVISFWTCDCDCGWCKDIQGSILTFPGYHVPAVRHRDAFYQKLEDERAAALGQK